MTSSGHRGDPVKVIKIDLTGLKLHAKAGISLGGEAAPVYLKEEGPFGEYMGIILLMLGKSYQSRIGCVLS